MNNFIIILKLELKQPMPEVALNCMFSKCQYNLYKAGVSRVSKRWVLGSFNHKALRERIHLSLIIFLIKHKEYHRLLR